MSTASAGDWKTLIDNIRAILPGGWMYEASWMQFDPPDNRELGRLVNWFQEYADRLRALEDTLQALMRLQQIPVAKEGPAIGLQIPEVHAAREATLNADRERLFDKLHKLEEKPLRLSPRLQREREKCIVGPYYLPTEARETLAGIRARAEEAVQLGLQVRQFMARPKSGGQPANRVAVACGGFMARFDVGPAEIRRALKLAGVAEAGLPSSKTLQNAKTAVQKTAGTWKDPGARDTERRQRFRRRR